MLRKDYMLERQLAEESKPQSSGIGGVFFLLVSDAEVRMQVFHGRETDPPQPERKSILNGLPGQYAGGQLAQRRS